MKLGKAIKHTIVIDPSHNMGFIVTIGCGKFVAANYKSLVGNLEDYFKDPERWEKEYSKITGCTDEARPEPGSERVPPPTPPNREVTEDGDSA